MSTACGSRCWTPRTRIHHQQPAHVIYITSRLQTNTRRRRLTRMRAKLPAIVALLALLSTNPQTLMACEAYCQAAGGSHGSRHGAQPAPVTSPHPITSHRHFDGGPDGALNEAPDEAGGHSGHCDSNPVSTSIPGPVCENLPAVAVLQEGGAEAIAQPRAASAFLPPAISMDLSPLDLLADTGPPVHPPPHLIQTQSPIRV